MREWLEKRFRLQEHQTSIRREVAGGLTTFMTMAYIIFVQPAVLGAGGMDTGSVMVATCLASAIAIFLMGWLANYPIALAPGMGHNFFFTYTVVLTLGFSWQQGLGAVFISGSLFVLLSFVGLREHLIHAVPPSLKNGIAVGIGLLIALVGLEWSGLVVDHPNTLVTLGRLNAPPTLLSLFGLAVMGALLVRGVRAAILIGILASTMVGLFTDMIHYQGIVGRVPSLAPTFLKLDVKGALQSGMFTVIFVFFFLDLFDTVGTLIGVTQEAGLLEADGRLPRARQALLSDALGTVIGSLLGTSTVTSYIESASGVSAGARTGLANLVTGSLFLLALFFSPLIHMVAGGIPGPNGTTLYPVIAPALIVVGCFMIRNVSRIPWRDFSEALPAFLTILLMPLTFSITEGIAFGFIAYTFFKLVQGRLREVPALIVVFAILFTLRYVIMS